jgi:hypothetical protein
MFLSPAGVEYGRRAIVPHPAHTAIVDLDNDQQEELLVADLGSFLPEDHGKGQVLWLRPLADGTGFNSVKLLGNIGRVTDIEAADFDQAGVPRGRFTSWKTSACKREFHSFASAW